MNMNDLKYMLSKVINNSNINNLELNDTNFNQKKIV